MKHLVAAIGILVILLTPVCKKEQVRNQNATNDDSVMITEKTDLPRRVNLDSLFSVICRLQDSIYRNPNDMNLIKNYTQTSFDSTCGCFFVVGKGVANSDFPAATREKAKRTAAERIAQRWALYARLWRDNNMLPFGRPITGFITYSTVVKEQDRGDTLQVFLQIPLGSIALR
jgi:hypothetical protein